MRKNEQGFGLVEILLVIVVIGLLGVVGWQFFSGQKDKAFDKTSDTQQITQETIEQKLTENTNKAPRQIDTAIHEVNISLKTEADLAKLPDYTPSSFKSYLAEKLRNNKSFDNGETMVTETWKINKISQVNIQGGQVPTDKDGNGYPGGAPAIWVLAPAGTWDQETLNGPVCTSKNGGKIYEEFVAECYTDYSGTQASWKKNPNGSIKSLNN